MYYNIYLEAMLFIIWDNICKIRWSWIKTRKIKGRKDQLSTAKTHKHIPIGLALVVRYSKILTKEHEYLIYRGEGCADVFAKKIEKIL